MSQDEPMFTVHTSHLNTGLRGVPVGTCRTSFVTPTEAAELDMKISGYSVGMTGMVHPG